jgi:hypothetical protein
MSSPEIAIQLLDALGAESKLTPDKVANSEPIKHQYEGPEDFLKSWWAKSVTSNVQGGWSSSSSYHLPVFLKRSRFPTFWIKFELGEPSDPKFGLPGSVTLESQWDPTIDYATILKKWCQIIKADFGILHLFTEAEIQGFSNVISELSSEDEKDNLSRNLNFFRSGLFMSPTSNSIPNLGWANFFAETKADNIQFGLIQDQGFDVEATHDGNIVYVCPDLKTVDGNFPEFCRKRDVLKSLFPEGYFLIKQEPALVPSGSNLN